MDVDKGVSKVFSDLCELGYALGWRNVNRRPGCSELEVDAAWWAAVNPHSDVCACSRGVPVPAYSIYIEFNGWPAGFCDAAGGILARGRLANEEILLEAIRIRTAIAIAESLEEGGEAGIEAGIERTEGAL